MTDLQHDQQDRTDQAAEDRSLRAVPLFASHPDAHTIAPPVADLADVGWSTATPVSGGGVGIDWEVVRIIKTQSVAALQPALRRFRENERREPTLADRRELAKMLIRDAVTEQARRDVRDGIRDWSAAEEAVYAKAVLDSQFGFGRLQPLFEIETAENITIHGHDSVIVQHTNGQRERHPAVADSDEELMQQLVFMAENATPRRAFNPASPEMTLMVGHQFRIHAISHEFSTRPSVAIRRHHLTHVSLADLADLALMPIEVAEFLDRAVKAGKSIVVAGPQGAGKTTLLRALIDSIPRSERIATLETDLELFSHLEPGRDNDLALVSRTGMGETGDDGSRIGDITVSDMIPPSLRQAVSRVVVGEVRGNEGAAMMEAMQVGVGTLSTTHSKSAHSIADRLAARAAQTGRMSIEEAYIQIGLNIDLFVYVHLVDDTWRGGPRFRVISEILQVKPGDNIRPSHDTIYRTDPSTFQPAAFTPPGDLVAELARYEHPLTRYRSNRT